MISGHGSAARQLASHLKQEQFVSGTRSPNLDPLPAGKAMVSSPKRRYPLSAGQSTASPAPVCLGPAKCAQDDIGVGGRAFPGTSKRPSLQNRGLSLQMPPSDTSSSSTNLLTRTPSSPKLDQSICYGSMTSVLPRSMRGQDFSRFASNLHHSTIADRPSPESSPVVGTKGMNIPRRNYGIVPRPDSPMGALSGWNFAGHAEKQPVSGSLGNVDMHESDSDSNSSFDDPMAQHEEEAMIHMTPQASRGRFSLENPFVATVPSPGIDLAGPFPAVAGNRMNFQRRLRRTRSNRRNGLSYRASTGPVSPQPQRSIEFESNGGYVQNELWRKDMRSRRESLSLGTDDMHTSEGAESSDPETLRNGNIDTVGIPLQAASQIDERRNVIRRAVATKRSNMLPQTKGFARVRAALMEESCPIDAESRREAEVIRQVKEGDNGPDSGVAPSQPTTGASSPNPRARTGDSPDDISEMGAEPTSTRRSSSSFSHQAMRNASGIDFWNSFDDRMRTPPPPFFPRSSSSGMSEDVNMDTPMSSLYSCTPLSAPLRSTTPQSLMAAEVSHKRLGKRRREDDFDADLFKRRAVSPGHSVQGSPILPPSPMHRDGGWWQAKATRETPSGHTAGDRVSNGSSCGNGGLGRRVGLQGMNDTNDGISKMAID